MMKSRMCGSAVMPYPRSPISVSTIDHSCGASTSSTGPSNCRTNTAETRRGPARTKIGSSTSRYTPLGSEVRSHWSIASSATGSPSMEISICSLRMVEPDRPPVVVCWNAIVKR